MRTMLISLVKRLFVERNTENTIYKSKYTTMMHKKMQKMKIPAFFTAYSLKHAAIEKLVCLKMELPKINKSVRLAMNSTVALTHYSPLATSNNTVCALITKDEGNQKEEVNKLLVLEKDKFEEEIQLSDEKKEYQDEYNKLFVEDQEIESIVLYKKKDFENAKPIKSSQKRDKSDKEKDNIQKEVSFEKSVRESQKILLKNVFKFISAINQGK
jgi:hypothetical protein